MVLCIVVDDVVAAAVVAVRCCLRFADGDAGGCGSDRYWLGRSKQIFLIIVCMNTWCADWHFFALVFVVVSVLILWPVINNQNIGSSSNNNNNSSATKSQLT